MTAALAHATAATHATTTHPLTRDVAGVDVGWLRTNAGSVVELAWDHVLLCVPAVVLSFLVAVPLGWGVHRLGRRRRTAVVGTGVLAVTGLVYAVPSLALFVILPYIMGVSILSPLNVVVALLLYGVALLVRVAAEAFATVDADLRDAAVAVGHSGWGRFVAVELPLAGPALLTGVRVVSASTVSLASVGSLIGVSTLGDLFTRGFQRGFPTQVLAGVVGVVAVAVVLDLVLVGVGRVLMPWRSRAGV
ncbi:ABC transporter permease [Corynebacterium bovis]|uniref:Osmoprotectant transport system permease protein n=1 Tax=Corynebacterium bovis DSM 20582 = CIP 54.80 TaxID=927655 RepID=A0A8H9YD58_9CORY|nr:ABC transporter permease subunit [Corynebacterium bovis]MBB3116786.1 osmoprotectant transport system permease protein [Corynebacterium bovis DSM 20582 = CIP 54.80]QQC46735.1 ABC transporter permease subunit [Corynebacterium bovis]RRO79076.1 ABC transporter permease [Corynebacterium bovis]RRO79962.1 ABC transporter permease [Corynebacterium bovis]RRO80639.1 ABC transporter permease [Corynebacterium bovis]